MIGQLSLRAQQVALGEVLAERAERGEDDGAEHEHEYAGRHERIVAFDAIKRMPRHRPTKKRSGQ